MLWRAAQILPHRARSGEAVRPEAWLLSPSALSFPLRHPHISFYLLSAHQPCCQALCRQRQPVQKLRHRPEPVLWNRALLQTHCKVLLKIPCYFPPLIFFDPEAILMASNHNYFAARAFSISIVTSPTTAISSPCVNAAGKLSEKRICADGGNSSSPAHKISRTKSPFINSSSYPTSPDEIA